MNCTEFDSTLMDALAGELDEARRGDFDEHAATCAMCRDLLAGFEATLALTGEDAVALPAGFEERLHERVAAAEAGASLVGSAAPPSSRRGAGVVDFIRRTGRWAMSPQFAMAATFLLVIGSSAMWLRKGSDAQSPASAVAVADGEEAQQAASDLAPAAPLPSPARDEQAQANAGFARARAAATTAPPPAVARPDEVPAARGGALAQSAAADPWSGDDPSGARGGGGAKATDAERRAPAAASPATTGRSRAFEDGLAAYRAQRYSDATRTFDQQAATGDDHAALWAARSVREGQGCATALPRFERLAARSKGTPSGNDALLDSARCNRVLGNGDRARDHYNRLLDEQAYAARARAELDSMGHAAGGPAHASPKRATTKAAPGTAGTTRNAAPVDRDDPFAGSSGDKRSGF